MAEVTTKTTAHKRKQRRSVPVGQVHIQASFNNTIVTITDPSGKTLASSSAGSCGFKGSRKGTAYAAQLTTEAAAEKVKPFGLKQANVFIRGIGQGREAAVRALINTAIMVSSLKDVTGIPHNGCRPRKARRM